MMAEPILEQIAANLLTALSGITVANGYHYTLTGTRPIVDGYYGDAPCDLTFQLTQGQEELLDGAALTQEFIQPFMVVVIAMNLQTDTTPIDKKRNRILADIRKAVMSDYTRGGLAIDTMWGPSSSFMNDGDFVFEGVMAEIRVHYRTEHNDPYGVI